MFRNLDPRALAISGDQSELIEWALSYGFKGLSIDVESFAEDARQRGMAHARRLFDSAKLKLATFRLPIDWTCDDAAFAQELQRLAPLADCAAELGCTRALTEIASGSDERPYHQNFEFHRQRLKALGDALGRKGIRLGVGFDASGDARSPFALEFIRDLDALTMLLGMVGSEHVGLVVDLWQMAACGKSLESVKKFGPERVVAVFAADAPAEASDGPWLSKQRLMPGESGVIDLASALVTLAEWNYAGPISPAPHESQTAGKSREAIAKVAGAALEQAWKTAGLSPGGKLAAATARR